MRLAVAALPRLKASRHDATRRCVSYWRHEGEHVLCPYRKMMHRNFVYMTLYSKTNMGYLKTGIFPENFITFIIRQAHILVFLSTKTYQFKLYYTMVITAATAHHIIPRIPVCTNKVV